MGGLLLFYIILTYINHIESHGYGSIPINTIFSGLFTSINPSYDLGFTRGTRVLTHSHMNHQPNRYGTPNSPQFPQRLPGSCTRPMASNGGPRIESRTYDEMTDGWVVVDYLTLWLCQNSY